MTTISFSTFFPKNQILDGVSESNVQMAKYTTELIPGDLSYAAAVVVSTCVSNTKVHGTRMSHARSMKTAPNTEILNTRQHRGGSTRTVSAVLDPTAAYPH